MNKSTKRILLIDDNAIFRFLFENMLKSYDDEYIEFSSFENAIDALDYFAKINRAHIPDALYVDINMPYMNGWELMEKLKTPEYAFLQTAKIYIITSSDNEADCKNMELYPFIDEYLLKPISPEKLHQSLHSA